MTVSRMSSSRRICSKYKLFFIPVLVILLLQLFLAYNFYPINQYDENLSLSMHKRKSKDAIKVMSPVYHFPEFSSEKSPIQISQSSSFTAPIDVLYKPSCDINVTEVLSALSRAKTKQCKQEIADIACLIQKGKLYGTHVPRFCPSKGGNSSTVRYIGCFKDHVSERDMKAYHQNFPHENTLEKCLSFCQMIGCQYTGLQYGSECWCDNKYGSHGSLPESYCSHPCSGNVSQSCGGYLAQNIYTTGIGEEPFALAPLVDASVLYSIDKPPVRIAYILSVNGRAVRQVRRLFKALFHVDHYFYIHVDSRQEYLYRELQNLTRDYANVRFTPWRMSTIWGGASLLQMLLGCINDLLSMTDWHWDYVINLSESDFPVKTNADLVAFLTTYNGYNFLKSHGKNTPRFVKKQGLDQTFYECETRMWRLGMRGIPGGARLDGGSDWIGLHREFCKYVLTSTDPLVSGLKIFYKYTLLPAESFFHTVLMNSKMCAMRVDNNLHFTNWNRKQGCHCQYKHIVDWCGCSPNDILPINMGRILSLKTKPTYFARKFEAIVNQEVINELEADLYGSYPTDYLGLNSYWQNDYHHLDKHSSISDAHLTLYYSFIRRTVVQLRKASHQCLLRPVKLLEATLFNDADHFHGLLVLFQAELMPTGDLITVESHIHSLQKYHLNSTAEPARRLHDLKVGTEFDLKELFFRNLAGLLGPYSDITLRHSWFSSTSQDTITVTTFWIDPFHILAGKFNVKIPPGIHVGNLKPSFNGPLRPGVWTVKLVLEKKFLAETKFLISPLTIYHGGQITAERALDSHKGPAQSYLSGNQSPLKNPFRITDSERSIKEAIVNTRTSGAELEHWVDSIGENFWQVEDKCVVGSIVPSCYSLQRCHDTIWSSRSPDPKSELHYIEKSTGRIR